MDTKEQATKLLENFFAQEIKGFFKEEQFTISFFKDSDKKFAFEFKNILYAKATLHTADSFDDIYEQIKKCYGAFNSCKIHQRILLSFNDATK